MYYYFIGWGKKVVIHRLKKRSIVRNEEWETIKNITHQRKKYRSKVKDQRVDLSALRKLSLTFKLNVEYEKNIPFS